MNIIEAIDAIQKLNRAIEQVNRALKAAESKERGRPTRVSVSVFVEGAGSTDVNLDRDACIKALQDTKAGYEARIAKLKPVIDMANAALKGLMT